MSMTALLLPILVYFWADLPVRRLPLVSTMTAGGMVEEAKRAVETQLQFIIAHELGHVFLGHNDVSNHEVIPISRFRYSDDDQIVSAVSRRHTEEYSADMFAAGYLKTALLNEAFEIWMVNSGAAVEDALSPALSRVPRWRTHVETLFLLMDFVEDGGKLIDQALGREPSRLPLTHPPALSRLAILARMHPSDIRVDRDYSGFVAATLDGVLGFLGRDVHWLKQELATLMS
jgi:hypothetical protein